MKTVVFQSFRDEGRPDWIELCLETVKSWAGRQGHEYRFLGDELLERVPSTVAEKSEGRNQIVADLGRLLVAREILEEGIDQVIWLDADTLVFEPQALRLEIPRKSPGYAFGREVWIQKNASGRLKAYRNVHNAVCLFQRDNPFLDFYIHACLLIMERVDGGVPPQIIGPKFLSAQYNILGFPLFDSVGAFSPVVLQDILNDGRAALDLLVEASPFIPLAANLCASLSQSDEEMRLVCERLLAQGARLFSRSDAPL